MWEELRPGVRGRTGPGAIQPGRHRGRPERRLARPLAIASLAGLLAAGGVTACAPQTTGATSGQVTSPATVAPTTPAPSTSPASTPTATASATPTPTATVTATPTVTATVTATPVP
jgi:hypothetical protein